MHGGAASLLCVAASHAGRVAAVELWSGSPLWSVTVPSRVEAACCVCALPAAPPVVLVGAYDGCVHALRLSDGERLWSRRMRGAVKAAACALPRSVAAGGAVARPAVHAYPR